MATILEDCCAELVNAVEMKRNGVAVVPAAVAGTDHDVSIDEYIARWRDAIVNIANGADESQFNY